MAVKQIEIFEECAIAGDVCIFYTVPHAWSTLRTFKGLIHLHQMLIVVEIIVLVDKHLAAGDFLRILYFHGNENRSYQSCGKGENAHCRLISEMKHTHQKEADHYRQDSRHHYYRPFTGRADMYL